MKHSVAYKGIFIFLLFGLAGCTRIIDWGTDVFDQGENLERIVKPAQLYLKSVTVYDQFNTAGMFDALWLSDQVRMVYADLYSQRRGRDEEYNKTFLRRQLEENSHYITFYVLSPYEKPLGDAQSVWHMYLAVDDIITYPIEVMKVELDPEYAAIFGKKLTRFKESYIVRFDAKNVDGDYVLTNQTKELSLVFKSIEKIACVTWNIKALDVKFDYQESILQNNEDCKESYQA